MIGARKLKPGTATVNVEKPPPASTTDRATARSKPSKATLPPLTRVTLYGTFTSALAILAAIGIQGDVLGRLIRNDASTFPLAIAVVFIGAIIPVAGITFSARAARYSTWIGILILSIGLVWLIALGTGSLALRDQPVVNLSTRIDSQGNVHISADSSTSSLKANETMLLDVKTIDAVAAEGQGVNFWCRAYLEGPARDSAPARSIYWGETGPSTTGSATDRYSVVLKPSSARYVCARSALRVESPSSSMSAKKLASAEAKLLRNARDAVVIIDLNNMQPTTVLNF